MSETTLAVQTAVYSALTANSSVQAQLGNPARVYDFVPPNATYPYARIGEVTAEEWDTKDRTGMRQILTIDIFSRYRGEKELKDCMNAIYGALHRATLSVSGAQFVMCDFIGSITERETDGLATKAEMRFNVITQAS